MSSTDFEQSTSQKGPRWKVRSVDKALRSYRSANADDAPKRFAKVTTLITKCNRYLAHPDDKATRKAGVRTLLQQAQLEEPLYNKYSQAVAAAAKVQKVTLYNEALDAYLVARRHHGVDPVDLTTKIHTELQTMTPLEKQQLVQSDLAELQNLLGDGTLPALTRDILTEVLANAGNVRLDEGAPGAKEKRPWEAQPEGYTVTHSVEQKGGTAERLGSLAHELTHVSVGQSYKNSSFFFMIESDASDGDIVDRARGRQARIVELRNALQGQRDLTPDQIELVNAKLDYGGEDKLPLYIARYGDAGRAAQQRGDDAKARYYFSEADKARTVVDALGGTGLTTSLLVEYDTVINQMLVYMHLWHVSPANAFYQKLNEVGQEVYDERQNARAGHLAHLGPDVFL